MGPTPPGGLEDLDGALAVLGLDHLEAVAPQAEGQWVAEVLLILDQEDAGRADRRSRRRSGLSRGLPCDRHRGRHRGGLGRAHDALLAD